MFFEILTMGTSLLGSFEILNKYRKKYIKTPNPNIIDKKQAKKMIALDYVLNGTCENALKEINKREVNDDNYR